MDITFQKPTFHSFSEKKKENFGKKKKFIVCNFVPPFQVLTLTPFEKLSTNFI